MAGITVEGELGNNGQFPLDIQQGQVQFPRFIFKNAEVQDFIGDIVRVLFRIPLLDAKKDGKAFPD